MFPKSQDPQSGAALLLVMVMVGAVFSVVVMATSRETRNKAVESQRYLAANALKQNGTSAIRMYDQYLRSGFMRADCTNGNRLKPAKYAPPEVSGNFTSGKGLKVRNCDASTIRKDAGLAKSIFRSKGKVPAADSEGCGQVDSYVSVEDVDVSTRTIELRARTAAPKKTSAVYGKMDPPTVSARLKLPPPPVPSFGLLVNDLHCGMCHVKVIGDVASTKKVTEFHYDPSNPWKGFVDGAWYANKTWHPQPNDSAYTSAIDITVTDGVFQNYNGPKLPGIAKVAGGVTTIEPKFPVINFANIGTYKNPDPYTCDPRPITDITGSVPAATGKAAIKVQSSGGKRHVVWVGTDANPIKIESDYFIDGDLVIKGKYSGVGSIYVTGNIYVPFDLIAKRSIWPYASDKATAEAQARASMQGSLHDGLGLATKRNIIIGEFEVDLARVDLMPPRAAADSRGNSSVWYHGATPADKRGDSPSINVRSVYSWMPGGRAGYEALFEQAMDCTTLAPARKYSHPAPPTTPVDLGPLVGSFNRIDAYLYAENTIGGLARQNSYSINGGIISDNFHIVSGSQSCKTSTSIHPVHGRGVNWSYVAYDYRMKFGLPLLDRFSEYFITNPE